MRFGEEDVPEADETLDGVAHNSIDLDETQEYVDRNYVMKRILVLTRLWGLWECYIIGMLRQIGSSANASTPATCHSEGTGSGSTLSDQPIMSPNQGQTLPQDPAQVHHHK